MRKVAMIPARFGSQRFENKLMHKLTDGRQSITVIRLTYINTVATGLFDEVIVVTDDEKIYQEITSHGGKALMSEGDHQSGTDRIAEAAKKMEDVDVIVNVQGDEPFVNAQALADLLAVFEGEKGKTVQVGSVMKKLENADDIKNPNFVKVVVDKEMNALFFSRSKIPYERDTLPGTVHYEHVGVYAFRRDALLLFSKTPMSMMEKAEKVECLRYLENCISIKMVTTTGALVEIDTPDDLVKANRMIAAGELKINFE